MNNISSNLTRLERSGRIATVTLSHPPVNALSRALVAELAALAATLAADIDRVRCIVTVDTQDAADRILACTEI